MDFLKYTFCAILVLCTGAVSAQQKYVIEDGGVGITQAELEQLVSGWTPQMQRVAADDIGDRMELLNHALTLKKVSMEVEKISLENDPETYWDYHFKLRNMQQAFLVDHFIANVEVPDMSDLSRERYDTLRDKYALVKEERLSSHILLKCPPGTCSRPEKIAEARVILAELEAGADFEEVQMEHSEDPSTKRKGGRVGNWMNRGTTGISPPYLDAVFKIGEVGGYSDVVQTEFGVHIIRLDDLKPTYYKTYDQVKGKIEKDLEAEYRQLALKDFQASFRISDEGYIDGDAMDEIFAPYKTKQASAALPVSESAESEAVGE